MSAESPTNEERLKAVETTVATWGRELHAIYEQAHKAATETVAMNAALKEMRTAKEKVDVPARVLAIIAIVAVAVLGLALLFGKFGIIQMQDVTVERERTMNETLDDYVRDANNVPHQQEP